MCTAVCGPTSTTGSVPTNLCIYGEGRPNPPGYNADDKQWEWTCHSKVSGEDSDYCSATKSVDYYWEKQDMNCGDYGQIGTLNFTYTCLDDQDNVVNDSFCSNKTKPKPLSIECSCADVFSGNVDFECEAECGSQDATETRPNGNLCNKGKPDPAVPEYDAASDSWTWRCESNQS